MRWVFAGKQDVIFGHLEYRKSQQKTWSFRRLGATMINRATSKDPHTSIDYSHFRPHHKKSQNWALLQVQTFKILGAMVGFLAAFSGRISRPIKIQATRGWRSINSSYLGTRVPGLRMVLLIPRSLWIKVYGCLLCLDLDGFFSGFPSGHSWILDGRRARCGWLASHPGTCLERKPGNTLVYSKPLRNVRRHVKTFHFLIVIKYLYYLYSSGLHWVTNHEKKHPFWGVGRFDPSPIFSQGQHFHAAPILLIVHPSCCSQSSSLNITQALSSCCFQDPSQRFTAWPSNSHISPKFRQIPIFSPCMIIIDRIWLIWPYKSS